jgi:hypothetical protein
LSDPVAQSAIMCVTVILNCPEMSLSCEFNKQQLIENIQVRCAIQCNITRKHQSAKGEHSRILEEIHLFK